MEHRWPGNVRELRNAVERSVYRWERPGPIDLVEIDPFASPFRPRTAGAAPIPAAAPITGDAPEPAAPDDPCDDFKTRVNRFERQLLTRAMAEARYNQRTCADALGLTYDQLRHALKRHGLLGQGAERPCTGSPTPRCSSNVTTGAKRADLRSVDQSLHAQGGTPMAFELPPLPYAYDALEPTIDKETMTLHHDKHHQAYTDKLNEAVSEDPSLEGKSIEELMANMSGAPPSCATMAVAIGTTPSSGKR